MTRLIFILVIFSSLLIRAEKTDVGVSGETVLNTTIYKEILNDHFRKFKWKKVGSIEPIQKWVELCIAEGRDTEVLVTTIDSKAHKRIVELSKNRNVWLKKKSKDFNSAIRTKIKTKQQEDGEYLLIIGISLKAN
jgi:hypothetical protein